MDEMDFVLDHGLLKAFPMLAMRSWECPHCKRDVENKGQMIVNGPRSGYVKCECGYYFDPEVEQQKKGSA